MGVDLATLSPMRDIGQLRGWGLVLAVLAVASLAAIALLLGLEAMSWIAAGVAVVLGIIPLFGTAKAPPAERAGDGDEPREAARERPDDGSVRSRPARWPQWAVLGIAVLVFGAAVLLNGVVKANAPEAVTCPAPRDPTTQAKVTAASSAAHPDVRLESMVYSLSYNGSKVMYLEVSGRIRGKVPEDQMLYPFGTADPKSRDMDGHPGNGRFYWAQDELIVPDGNGCWSKPQREFGGYAGARGLTFYYHLGLVPRAQLSCLQALVAKKEARENGQSAAELGRCGVTLLGYGHIPTDPL